MTANVFNFQLPRNSVKRIAVASRKADAQKLLQAAIDSEEQNSGKVSFNDFFRPWVLEPVETGVYLDGGVVQDNLGRLRAELETFKPNVVVAMGATAIWALTGRSATGAVKKLRGTIQECALVPGVKVIPTFHPAAILRTYRWKIYLNADFLKAKREAISPGIAHQHEYEVEVAETVEQVRDFLTRPSNAVCAVDIETAWGQIDCIGFARSDDKALVVPFFDIKTFENWWHKPIDEVSVRRLICDFLRDSAHAKVFQNGSYDVQWLWEKWRCPVRGYTDDTRLLHHALWPELPKDLGTMASLHLELPSWKPVKGSRQKRED